MGSCVDVVLNLGYDSRRLQQDLHHYLVSEIPGANGCQRLALVSGSEISEDLPGSGQAGTIRIYAGLIRKTSAYVILEFLEKAPWSYHTGELLIRTEDFDTSYIILTSSGSKTLHDGALRL